MISRPASTDRSAVGLLAVALTIVFGGTAGYMWIEGWKFADSFYMTIITLSTVGFQEVRPLGDAGRMFTAILILLGVATLGYALRALGDRIVADASSRLRRRIHRMRDHTIVCGYGRTSRPVVEGLAARKHPCAVIEISPERAATLADSSVPVIVGDATAEEALLEAGLERANTVATLLPSDGDNLSITMTAKALNPDIRVIARSEDERSRVNLHRAGAQSDDVVSPHTTAGNWVLQQICGVQLSRIAQGIGAMMEQGFGVGRLAVEADSPYAGRTLGEAGINTGRNLLVLAIHQTDGRVTFAPTGSRRVARGETLVILGRLADVQAAGAVLDPDFLRHAEL